MKAVLALTAALVLALPARAEFFDGNKLYEQCISDTAWQRGDCLGYTSGVFDSLQGIRWCAPENVTRGQVRDIVVQHLRDNPATRSSTSADVLIRVALESIWPCPARPRQPQSNPRSSSWS